MPARTRAIPVGLVFAAMVAAAAGAALLRGGSNLSTDHQGPVEIVAASFTSAWCSSCKVLAPRLAAVIPAYAGQPVAFVELDFTFGQTEARGAAARAAGVETVYRSVAGATGFTVLVDADTGVVLDTLTMNHSSDAMRDAIDRAIAIAASTDDQS